MLRTQKPQVEAIVKELVTIGDHIRQKRLELKLTQKQTALLIGVEECTIWNWETGGREPDIPIMPRVVAFLGYVPYNPMWTLGEKLIAWRKSVGLSRSEMARAFQIDPSTLARYEQNKRLPTTQLLQKTISFINDLE